MTREKAIAIFEEFKVVNDWTAVHLPQMEDAVDMAIEAQSAEAEWIPVSERLPDVDVEVLTTTDWPDVLIAWLNKDGAWETEELILANDEILAWMPLPEPYREDKE